MARGKMRAEGAVLQGCCAWSYTGYRQEYGRREGVWHVFMKLNLQETLSLGCIDQDEIPEGSDAVTQWHH